MSPDEMSPQASKEQRLNTILAEYMKRKDAGQITDQEAMLLAYPDLADGLQSYFQNEAMMGDPAFAATELGPVPSMPSEPRETMRPGNAAADTASEFSARTFGRYLLLRPLGEGAMGSVYLAQDTTLDRRVALKIPKQSTDARGSEKTEFLQRFTREARAAAGLKHPNICSVYDAGEIESTAYITMDFIDGVPLSRLIGSGVLKSPELVLKMIRTIAEAVGHAHEKGVIHRDLKPGNILVDNDMAPYVTDFGLARREAAGEGSRITQEGLLIGTPAYMAPEQVRGEQNKVGIASDIYSLGVVLFEMLTTRLPFDGTVPDMLAKALRDNPPVPSRLRSDLTEDMDDVILKMMQKDPSRRFRTMAEVIVAIEKLQKKLKESVAITDTASSRAHEQQARSSFEIQKSHVELMLKKGQYANAIRELEALATEPNPAARSIAEWAQTTLPRAKKEAKAMSPSGLAAMFQTAQQLFQKSDYLGCIQIIDEVPSLKRSEAMERLFQQAQQREAAAEELMEQIRDKEHREIAEGLEPLVRKYLKLKPGNSYAKRLWQALQTYSKTPASRRYYRFEKGRLQPLPEPGLFRRYAMLAVLVGLLSFLASYSYVVFYLKNGSQTLAVYVDDEWLKEQGGEVTLTVDGSEHRIRATSKTDEPLAVVVKFGEREFSVRHGNTIVHSPKKFTIEKNGRSVLQITPDDMELRSSPLRPGSPDLAQGESQKAADKSSEIPANANPSPVTSDLDRVATGPWIPLLDSTTKFPDGQNVKVVDGILELNRTFVNFPALSERNIAIRADVRKIDGVNIGLHLRRSKAEDPSKVFGGWNAYGGWFSGSNDAGGDFFGIGRAGFPWVNLAKTHTGKPIGSDEFVDLAFVSVGDQLTLYVDGQKILEAVDSTFTNGIPALDCSVGSGLFRNARYQLLPSGTEPRMSAGNTPSAASAALAVAPFDERQAKSYQKECADRIGEPVEYTDSVGIRLRLIPRGEFSMGSPDQEENREACEGPQHRVQITQPFYLGATEITQKQWFQVMGTKPWLGQLSVAEGDEYPATYVDWIGATEFCRRLSERSGKRYRLPTEAEWEHACRAGSTSKYYFSDNVEDLDAHGWLDTNTKLSGNSSAQQVGRKQPNAFGLFDMHGNLFEWCQDYFSETAYLGRNGTTLDPVVSSAGEGLEMHVTRGGAWDWNGYFMRSALRGRAIPGFRSERDGFRVVRAISDSPTVQSRWTRLDPEPDREVTVTPGEPAVAPLGAAKARAFQKAWAVHLGLPVEYRNSVGMTFRLIPPGTFQMGSTPEELESARAGQLDHTDPERLKRLESQGPRHTVTLTKPFYLGVTEVTQEQYEAVMGKNTPRGSWYTKTGGGREFVGEDEDRSKTPAEMITWVDTGEFCGRLTIHEGLPSAYVVAPEKISQTGAGGYRLPTEAEWEFACRAGTETPWWSGDTGALFETAWTAENSNRKPPRNVAMRPANPFGLFDMHGNVAEWVHDGWDPEFYGRNSDRPAVDPRQDIPVGDLRIIRGGSFYVSEVESTSATRYTMKYDTVWVHTGFRVALSTDAVRMLLTK